MNTPKILTKYLKKNIPDIRSGDTVKVYSKIKEGGKERIQVFEGLVIATHGGKGLDASYKVRKESYGIGIERTFPLHSPRVIKVERIKQSKVRRSKLYYLRSLSGKAARLKELNRDFKMWEEPEAEKELEKIAEETAKQAEETAAQKEAEEAELEKKAESALAAHGDKPVANDKPKEVKEVETGSEPDKEKPVLSASDPADAGGAESVEEKAEKTNKH